MESSRRDLSNDMAEHRSILKKYQNTYYPRFGVTPMAFPKTGFYFYCVDHQREVRGIGLIVSDWKVASTWGLVVCPIHRSTALLGFEEKRNAWNGKFHLIGLQRCHAREHVSYLLWRSSSTQKSEKGDLDASIGWWPVTPDSDGWGVESNIMVAW